MWLHLDKQPPEIENELLLTAACPNQEFKSEITIMVSQYLYTIHQWSKCTIVGPNEVVLLVQIVQMNQAECDSFAQFVPTPDIPPPKNYQDIYFYIECDSSIGSRTHKNQGILFVLSYTKKKLRRLLAIFCVDIYVQIYIWVSCAANDLQLLWKSKFDNRMWNFTSHQF